ncbi:MAG: acetyl-CoA carboxylase biotin carboxylase subunit [Cyclobacteriaceae bacterium]|nr:acetyl-CoA carboxylase biotin carboxylase subunit [Cyclobacteriaceae bacterium HetDA_MAG_MS6]
MSKKIQKILIANRGEIAMRVIRSARELGISTVAVYSEADKLSPHVRAADEAVCIGPPPSDQSYLDIDKIIDVCQRTEADAVHPGYGFLSENALFAEKCKEAGITFIGPDAKAISIMGDKLAAKSTVSQYDVPMVPGVDHAVSDVGEAKKIADKIGYPVLIKASAGGGGKGMRVVEQGDDLASQMERAMSEAQSSFGNPAVFVEKYVSSPKHIEVQIMGDQHGNIVYLFERDCSIQRRHQKVIEEAPSAILTEAQRKQIGEAAVNVAKSCSYFGAGTVEFIVDQDLNFYFLEMNTRLQVEHPVTEEITGLDLVKEQINIAEGNPLSFKQEDLKINGHSIEVRVYAEDPQNNFLPDIGKLQTYKAPLGPGVRLDDGFEQGMDIPIYYDPMIAKLITHGATRAEAIARMQRAIDEYQITGVKTTLPFCQYVFDHEVFLDGSYTTKFVEEHFSKAPTQEISSDIEQVAALSAFALSERVGNVASANTVTNQAVKSNWKKRAKY